MCEGRDIAKERYAVPIVSTYPFVVEEWLRNERERESFLDSAYESGSSSMDMERKKEVVRKSRKYHGDPVPDSEFFGY